MKKKVSELTKGEKIVIINQRDGKIVGTITNISDYYIPIPLVKIPRRNKKDLFQIDLTSENGKYSFVIAHRDDEVSLADD